jgi:AraC-like DNA-binding protein
MSSSAGRVVAVGCDPSVISWLRAVRHGADVSVVAGVDIDSAAADILGTSGEVIVDVGFVDRYGIHAYDAVRSAAAQASLVLYVRNVPRLVHRSLELVGRGADGTWVCGLTDQPVELRRILDDALVRKRARVAAGAAAEASGVGSESFWSRLLVALPNVLTHDDLSAALEMSPTQLRRMVQSSPIGTTRRLLMWARLVAAQRLFEETDMSVEAVAHFLNYSSASALHNACRRVTRASPRDLGRPGGLEAVLIALRWHPSNAQIPVSEASANGKD